MLLRGNREHFRSIELNLWRFNRDIGLAYFYNTALLLFFSISATDGGEYDIRSVVFLQYQATHIQT